ncbi:MAG: acyl-homoserine-lactone synthase [Bauldia sp.]
MAAPAVASPLSLAERIQSFLKRVEYRRAETDEAREAIFRLRYDAYLKEGAIQPSFGRRLSDRYDDLDNAWLIGIYLDGRLCSSIRIHVGSPDYPDMVAADVFGDFVKPELEAGKVIVDPTRFVVDPAMAGRNPELPYVTVRIGHMAAEYFEADIVLATVRQEHRAFYKKVFGHVSVCEPREYPLLVKPLGLMMLDVNASRPIINSRYPFFVSGQAERAQVFGPRPGWAPERRIASATGDAQALVG